MYMFLRPQRTRTERNLLVADLRDVENYCFSEIHIKRFNHKELIDPFEFPVQEGEVSLYDSLLSSNPKPRETEDADEDKTVRNQRRHPVDDKQRLLDCVWRISLSPSHRTNNWILHTRRKELSDSIEDFTDCATNKNWHRQYQWAKKEVHLSEERIWVKIPNPTTKVTRRLQVCEWTNRKQKWKTQYQIRYDLKHAWDFQKQKTKTAKERIRNKSWGTEKYNRGSSKKNENLKSIWTITITPELCPRLEKIWLGKCTLHGVRRESCQPPEIETKKKASGNRQQWHPHLQLRLQTTRRKDHISEKRWIFRMPQQRRTKVGRSWNICLPGTWKRYCSKLSELRMRINMDEKFMSPPWWICVIGRTESSPSTSNSTKDVKKWPREWRWGLSSGLHRTGRIKWRLQKFLDTIARLPGMSGQANDAGSAYPQVDMSDTPRLLNLPEPKCAQIWIRLPPNRRPKSCDRIQDAAVPLECYAFGPPLAGLLVKRKSQEIPKEQRWEKFLSWECLYVHRENIVSVHPGGRSQNGRKNQNIDPMCNCSDKEIDFEDSTTLFDQVYLDRSQRVATTDHNVILIQERCVRSNHSN